MTNDPPLFLIELNPASGVEETPEVRAWLDKVTALLNKQVDRQRLEQIKTEFSVYGTVVVDWSKTPNQTNEVYGKD